MSRKRQSNSSDHEAGFDPFTRHVEQALEHFSDPAWLGAYSPFATPYFLGQALENSAATQKAFQRGQALQYLLSQAAESLEHETRELLQLTYLKRNPQHDNIAVAMALHLSERSFYRLRLKAIRQLSQALNQTILPPLRSEVPPHRPIVGRAAILPRVLAALQAGHSFYISGPSGIGKTVLGATLRSLWLTLPDETDLTKPFNNRRRVFWYTLRAGFNDQVASLFFALGYFLREQGAAFTWQQLVADRGIPNMERLLGLLRHDLSRLSASLILICIDEVDALQDEISDHAQILHLIEELRQFCPTLLIGQRITLDADDHIRLPGVDQQELDSLLQAVQAPSLSVEQREQLLTHTRGNPALIVLFVALLHGGDEADMALRALAKSPSLEGLVRRLLRRLSEAEREVLMQLAVFRAPAPYDVWADEQTTLNWLQERELIQFVGEGGVQLLPHLRKLTYDYIPLELRPKLHLRALEVREARAEHLAALYHAIESQQLSWGVWHWFVHRTQAIERGQGAAALDLLRQIDPATLSQDQDRTVLHQARAELLELAGQFEEAELELQSVTTPPTSISRAWVRRLHGSVLEAQGRIEQALQSYRESLEALVGLPQHNAVLAHLRLSFLHRYRLQDIKQAHTEALLARAKADSFLGDIESMAGHYQQALEYLLSAKHITEANGRDLITLSRTYSYLGVVYVKLGELEEAIKYFNQAIECDEQRGDKASPLYDVMNRATAYSLMGQFEAAYQDACQGLEIAEKLHHTYLIAGLAACVAEACHGLSRLDEAEHYINHALNQEEDYFRASVLLLLGKIRHLQRRYAESIEVLVGAHEAAKRIEDQYTEASILECLGNTYHDQGSLELARAAFESALLIFIELKLVQEARRVQAILLE